MTTGTCTCRDGSRARSPSSPAAPAASAGPCASASPARAPRWSWPTSTRTPGGAVAARGRRALRASRRHRPRRAWRRCTTAAADALRRHRHLLQQRRHLPARRRLDPRDRPRGVAPRAGGEPDVGLPVLQVRASRTCWRTGAASIINTASFVAVMGAATSPDLLHGLQGRRARHVAASSACSSPARACGSTPSAPGR